MSITDSLPFRIKKELDKLVDKAFPEHNLYRSDGPLRKIKALSDHLGSSSRGGVSSKSNLRASEPDSSGREATPENSLRKLGRPETFSAASGLAATPFFLFAFVNDLPSRRALIVRSLFSFHGKCCNSNSHGLVSDP